MLALAGRVDEATDEAAQGPWRSLWAALAAAIDPELEAWEALDTLEPYRAARLVFDCETLRPGVVPPQRLPHRGGGTPASRGRLARRGASNPSLWGRGGLSSAMPRTQSLVP